MTLKHLLIGAALSAPLMLMARPATTKPIEVTNPDGTKIQLRLHGDEFFSFYTDVDCSKIMERKADGFFGPVSLDGRELQFNEEDVEALRATETENTRFFKAPARMASLDSEGRSKYPTIGNDKHSLVVLVQFADTKFTFPPSTFEDLMNKEGYNDYGAYGSAAEYYKASSNGKFTPIFNISPVVTLSQPAAYYAANSSRMGNFVKEAVTQLDEMGFDFSIYDYDNDGAIDTIYFFYAGYGAADTGLDRTTVIWPHQGDYTNHQSSMGGVLTVDGLRVGPYACSNECKGPVREEPVPDGIGAFCHEYGHVIGLPDLYDVSYQNGTSSVAGETPGAWDVMDQGSYNGDSACPPLFSAYEQWVCKWLEFDMAEEGTEYNLPALTSSERRAVRIPITYPWGDEIETAANEYYVAESRGNSSWDTMLPDHGLLLWRISYQKSSWTSNRVNTSQRSRVIPMSYRQTQKSTDYCWGNNDNRRYLTNIDINTVDTYVTSDDYVLYMSDITHDEETGSTKFGYNTLDVPMTVSEFDVDHIVANENGQRAFHLCWIGAPGASKYALTLYYNGTYGRVYLSSTNNQIMTRNYKDFVNVSTSNWNREWTAELQNYFGDYPSGGMAYYKFTPSKLPQGPYLGIEGVSSDSEVVKVVAGEGFIEAPAGAEIYNLQGVRTGSTGLAAGVYVVRTQGKIFKVLVK